MGLLRWVFGKSRTAETSVAPEVDQAIRTALRKAGLRSDMGVNDDLTPQEEAVVRQVLEQARTPGAVPELRIFTNVAGVTFEGRQQIIARCEEGESLYLRRRHDIPGSKTATGVYRANGEQIGFIPHDVSQQLAPKLDRGLKVNVELLHLTGGTKDKPTRGVNILITGSP